MASTDELALLYRQAAKQLTVVLRASSRSRRPFVVAQLRELARIMDALEPATARWIRETIAERYVAGLREADQALRAARHPVVVEGGFTGLDRRAVAALEGRLSRDLGATRGALTAALSLGDPRRFGPEAVARALEEDGRVSLVRGEAKVLVPSGKHWGLEQYSRMLARTAVADARRVSRRERYLANGVDVVKVVHTGTNHAVCAAWEGERLSLTGDTPGLPTVDQARSAGLFHPNCRHVYVVDTSFTQPGVPVGRATVPPPEPARPTLGLSPRAPTVSRAPRPSLS